MTNDELKKRLKELSIKSKSNLATKLNLPERTVQKYGTENPVPKWLVSYLDLYEENLKLKEQITRQFD